MAENKRTGYFCVFGDTGVKAYRLPGGDENAVECYARLHARLDDQSARQIARRRASPNVLIFECAKCMCADRLNETVAPDDINLDPDEWESDEEMDETPDSQEAYEIRVIQRSSLQIPINQYLPSVGQVSKRGIR